MTNLDRILFDLLVHHNCVIIPEFGGFISKRISSRIDYDMGIIHPPSKHVLFNKFLTADDGLLISSFVHSDKEDYNEVKLKLSNFVVELDKRLSSGEEISFKHIGTLKRSDNGNYSFKQDRSFNLLADAYGLKELDFVSLREIKEEELVPELKAVVPVKNKTHNRTLNRRKILRYAAAACILPLALYSFWIPFKSDFFSSGLISVNDFNPFYKKEIGVYEPVPTNKIEIKENTIEQTEKVISIESTNSKKEEIGSQIVSTPKTSFNKYYIVGCFSVKQNADNFISKLQSDGFTPLLVDGGKLYRVSVGQAQNSEHYQSLLESAKGKGYNGWTLKK